jgi:hypothetical protein
LSFRKRALRWAWHFHIPHASATVGRSHFAANVKAELFSTGSIHEPNSIRSFGRRHTREATKKKKVAE